MYGLKNVRQRRSDELSRVAWDQLEQLLAVYYRGQGFRVEHSGTGGAAARFDGGIDLKLFRDEEYIVVQCKHWNAKQVPHNEVHQLLGIMVNQEATGAILVTSGEFTGYARESAAKLGKVRLIDGDELRAMIGPVPESRSATDGPSATQKLVELAGNRFVAAAENRIFGRRRRGGVGRGSSTVGNLFLVKVVVPIALTLGAVLLLTSVFNRAFEGLLQKGSAPASQLTSAALTPGSHPSAATPAQSTAQSPPRVRSQTNPCHEMIDSQSGTYIDHCASSTPPRQPSEAERRELQRKADEAMRILAPNTPEFLP